MAGEDEEWMKFQKGLKEASEKRKAAGPNGQTKQKTDDVVEVHAEEPESGMRRPIKMASAKLPSELEVEEHELSHDGSGCKSKELDAPIVAENPREAAIEEVELGPAEAKKCRSVSWRTTWPRIGWTFKLQ